MNKNIFLFICALSVGCGTTEDVQPEANTTKSPVITSNTVDTANVAAPTNAPAKKLDYDEINKSILKDVSKKLVDKAASKQ